MTRREWILSTVFLLGLVCLDQFVLHLGDSLVARGRWRDRTQAPVVQGPWETLVLGNCRALVLDPAALENRLGQRVTIAGTLAESLGSLAFNAMAALDKGQGKRLLLILDDWILKTTLPEAKPEIERRLMWWSEIGTTDRHYLREKFALSGLDWLGQWSGLWKYQGRGFTLVKSWLAGNPPKEPAPAPSGHPVVEPPLDVARFAPQQETQFQTSAFAVSVLRDLSEKARRAEVQTVFVLPPMHWVRNTQEVNDKILEAARELSRESRTPLLNYLGNETKWAKRDDWWVDPGHLNQAGARVFTAALAQDLQEVWR